MLTNVNGLTYIRENLNQKNQLDVPMKIMEFSCIFSLKPIKMVHGSSGPSSDDEMTSGNAHFYGESIKELFVLYLSIQSKSNSKF